MKRPFLKAVVGVLAAALLVQFAPMLSPRSLTMTAQGLKGNNYYFEPADSPAIGELAKALEANSARLEAALRVSKEAPVAVYVYPSYLSFHVQRFGGILGAFLPSWVIGDNTRGSVFITSPLNPGPAHSPDSIMGAFVHEYIHVMTDRINGRAGKWLKEGLATYLAGQKPYDPFGSRLAGLSFADFGNIDGIRFGNIGGYDLSYLYVDFLARSFGMDKVVELLRSGEDYEKTFGKGKEEIFRLWKASL
jgi:hypothetical protein